MTDVPQPPQDEHRLIAERKRKIADLREAGIEPYPYEYNPSHHAAQLQTLHASLPEQGRSGETVRVAGRLMLFRDMGKLAFGHVQDETGRIQVMLRKDPLGEQWKVVELLDLGDFIGVEGEVIKSKTGEVTVEAKNIVLLSKSVRPLPDKHKGLKDEETRMRQRYLDLIMNPDVKEMFHKRAKIIDATRKVLAKHKFLEVETPALQTQYGGANAKPFITHINAWDMKMYLSISPELYLKRLLVGGFERVYTICKNFRNEGVDQTHNPEFTMMECYAAYWDYQGMMTLTEEIYEEAAKAVNGTTRVMRDGVELDFRRPWKRVVFMDAVKAFAGIDPMNAPQEELDAFLKKHHIDCAPHATRGEIALALFDEYVEDKLIQPCHVIDHPIESTPLCKTLRSGDARIIERFESYANGVELSNAYSELNDPVKQKELFLQQEEKGRGGDEEAHPMDTDYVEALEYGMPPAGGLGLGIDRMVIFLTQAEGSRDVILFPTVKPETKE